MDVPESDGRPEAVPASSPVATSVIVAEELWLPPVVPWNKRALPGKVAMVGVLAVLLAMFSLPLMGMFHWVHTSGVAALIMVAVAVGLFATRDPQTERHDAFMRARHRKTKPVRLGADGIALHDGRFVPYASIASVEREGALVRLTLLGEREPLFLRLPPEDGDRANRLLEHRAVVSAYVASDEARALAQKNDEPEPEWRARIETLGEAGGYRAMPIDRGRLIEVAADAQAEPTARIAACTLLGDLSGDEAQTVAAAARATAHPRVRVAIDALGEGAEAESESDAPTREAHSRRTA